MKNKLFIILPIALIVVVAAVCVFFFAAQPSSFRLDDQYYNNATLETISADDLQRLVDSKASFAVFVSQPSCRTSADFAKILQAFIAEHPLHLYEIAFSDLKTLPIADEVRFYPSFLIFKNGKLVDFLEADSDEDAGAYTSLDGFTTWFTKQVVL